MVLHSQEIAIRVVSGILTEDVDDSFGSNTVYIIEANEKDAEIQISKDSIINDSEGVSLIVLPEEGKMSVSWKGLSVTFIDNEWVVEGNVKTSEKVPGANDWTSVVFYRNEVGSISVYINDVFLGERYLKNPKNKSDAINIRLNKGSSQVYLAMFRWGNLEELLKVSEGNSVPVELVAHINPIVQMGPLPEEVSAEDEILYLQNMEEMLGDSKVTAVRSSKRKSKGSRHKKYRRHRNGTTHGVFTTFTK